MERSTLIGIGIVAVVGVGLAGLAVVGLGGGGGSGALEPVEELSAAPSTDRAAPDEAPDEAPAPIDVLITRGAGAASGGPMPEARVEPMGDAADAPRQGPLPEPTAGLLDAGIDDLMEDEREITSGDPYESLGAMPSEGAVQRRVDQLRDEVDSLARGYRQVADGTSDPAVAAEALHRAASLYDHIGSIPLHAPTDVSPAEMEAYMDRTNRMREALQREAQALREQADARLVDLTPPD